MCTGPELALAAAALSAAGTGVAVANQQHTLHKQDQQNAASIVRQSRIQDAANQQVGQQVQRLNDSSQADHSQAGLDEYLAQLRTTAPRNQQNFASPGVSSTYDALAGANLAATDKRAADQAGLLARIDAPTVQRQHESAQQAQLATLLGQLGSNSSAEAYLNQLRLHGIHDNPWLELASGALKAGGAAAGAYGGALGSTAATGLATTNTAAAAHDAFSSGFY